jgi:predicted RNA-binding Zn-ribbon protein involved in translation (DUF1610 family)
MSTIPPNICCPACQVSINPGTNAYDFDCPDCLARYAFGSIERLSQSKEKADAAKDALFELLLKARSGK